jgi:hypothetical protein
LFVVAFGDDQHDDVVQGLTVSACCFQEALIQRLAGKAAGYGMVER